MAPIRVGFIGLSTTGWAKGAHFPYLKDSSKYQIVAVCNSTVQSSRAAIKDYALPEATKAYGDPQDIANDPDVDLIVCAVRVDRHYEAIAPSLKAGKDVYVEWPLAKNYHEAKELLRLKNEGNVKRTVVGLQTRQAPIIKKLKELLKAGKLGKVLSSTWAGQASFFGRTADETAKYAADIETGGNLVTIGFGHTFDSVQNVLGYGFLSPPKTLLVNTRPEINILNAEGKVVEEGFKKTAFDTVYLHGVLSTGVPISMTLGGDKPFKGSPGLVWRIYCEKGEIQVTASGPFLGIGSPDMKVSLHDFGSDVVEEVPIPEDDYDQYGQAARNVARVYGAFADGEENCSFEDAVERHRLLQDMYEENGITA